MKEAQKIHGSLVDLVAQMAKLEDYIQDVGKRYKFTLDYVEEKTQKVKNHQKLFRKLRPMQRPQKLFKTMLTV